MQDAAHNNAAAELPFLPQLLAIVRQLAEIAESDLPPAEKLERLCVEIGTARFWAERIVADADNPPFLPGPHWRMLRDASVVAVHNASDTRARVSRWPLPPDSTLPGVTREEPAPN